MWSTPTQWLGPDGGLLRSNQCFSVSGLLTHSGLFGSHHFAESSPSVLGWVRVRGYSGLSWRLRRRIQTPMAHGGINKRALTPSIVARGLPSSATMISDGRLITSPFNSGLPSLLARTSPAMSSIGGVTIIHGVKKLNPPRKRAVTKIRPTAGRPVNASNNASSDE
jgi:hypothetical protein